MDLKNKWKMENLQKILLQKLFQPIETCLLPSGLFCLLLLLELFFLVFLLKARYLITSSKIRWGVKKESIRRVTLQSEKVSRPLKWKTNKEILVDYYYVLKIPKKFFKCSVLLFLLIQLLQKCCIHFGTSTFLQYKSHVIC